MGLATRVVDVSEHGQRISLDRGFLVVSDDSGERGRVPIDDVGALLLSAYGTSCTSPLVVALAERGALVVHCGRNHLPVAWTLPVSGHHAQARIMSAQVDSGRPLNKRLWRYIVQAKIGAQADALAMNGVGRAILDGLVGLVRSGDPANVEARAAHAYWPALFGADFRRDREADGVNAVLNYGYTVLRSSSARACVACGLHPGVSIRHRRDPLALADDVMEPFRPVVDCCVARLAAESRAQVTREVREELVELLGDVEAGVLRFVRSIAEAYVSGVCPIWKRADVAPSPVRHTNDDGRQPQVGDATTARTSGPRLREDTVLGVHEEVSWFDCHDDS